MSFACQPTTQGTCIFCRETELVIPWQSSDGGLGVCDLCSYALRHTWRKLRGELVAAKTPTMVRTYALVPRLRSGRAEADVSGYEFIVDKEGRLPYAEWAKGDDELCAWLGNLGVATWPETVRPCYLGYAGSADFAEARLVWAWGKRPHDVVPATAWPKFASFAELLGTPTPDAGFYLGVKAAFEGLLWRREVAPEANKLCVFLREPAMRYLRSLEPEAEIDDEAMVEVCHSAMNEDELEVAELLEQARSEQRVEEEREAAAQLEVEKKAEDKADGEEDSANDDVSEGFGFARVRSAIIPPGSK